MHIGRRKQIRLFDEKSNLICKYKSTQDKEQIILKTLQKQELVHLHFPSETENRLS